MGLYKLKNLEIKLINVANKLDGLFSFFGSLKVNFISISSGGSGWVGSWTTVTLL